MRVMPEALVAASATVVAFDFGTRRIGVAVGEPAVGMAHALAEIAGEENAPRFAAIGKILAEWHPAELVVGLPLAADGAENALTRRARRFARQLEGRFGLPVRLVDERYTSVEAESGLREAGASRALREKRIDSAAARLILEQFFHDQAA